MAGRGELTVEIVAPDRVLWSGTAAGVSARAWPRSERASGRSAASPPRRYA